MYKIQQDVATFSLFPCFYISAPLCISPHQEFPRQNGTLESSRLELAFSIMIKFHLHFYARPCARIKISAHWKYNDTETLLALYLPMRQTPRSSFHYFQKNNASFQQKYAYEMNLQLENSYIQLSLCEWIIIHFLLNSAAAEARNIICKRIFKTSARVRRNCKFLSSGIFFHHKSAVYLIHGSS